MIFSELTLLSLIKFGAFYSSFVLIWNSQHFHLLRFSNRTNLGGFLSRFFDTPVTDSRGSILIFKLCHFHLDLLGQMLHHHQRCYCISQICLCGFNEIGPSFKLTMRNNKFIKSLSLGSLQKWRNIWCQNLKVAILIWMKPFSGYHFHQ